MAITTVDGLLAAMTSTTRNRLYYNKGGFNAGAYGLMTSYWVAGGNPGSGTIPSSPATCSASTAGGIPIQSPINNQSLYLARFSATTTNGVGIDIVDRLAHMGGLSGIVTTTQAVNLDLSALLSVDNIAVRRGRSDWSNVQWFLEWYVATGSTSTTITVSYTDHNGVSGKTTTVTTNGITRTGHMLRIVPNGTDYIRSVDSVTLSTSTGTAGNFGVFAFVEKGSIGLGSSAQQLAERDWAQLGLPVIEANSCLQFINYNITTTAGTISGSVFLVQG